MDKNYKENTPVMKQIRDRLPSQSPARAFKKESFYSLEKKLKDINAALKSKNTGEDADFLKSIKPVIKREMDSRKKPMKEGGSVKRMNNGGAVMKGRGGKFKGIS